MHVAGTSQTPQQAYLTAVKQTEAHVSAQNLDAHPWKRNHFAAPESQNQGDTARSWPDLQEQSVMRKVCYYDLWDKFTFWAPFVKSNHTYRAGFCIPH